MAEFLERSRTPENYWRAVILFGQNVASYKFALAKSLIELSAAGKEAVSLEDLAEPFSRHIVEHLGAAPKQATSASSRFLEACREFARGKLGKDELIGRTAKLGFNNVINAFHIVNRGEIPIRFFLDDRQNGGGIRLTNELFHLRERLQFGNLPHEVEARWRLVETAWQLKVTRMAQCHSFAPHIRAFRKLPASSLIAECILALRLLFGRRSFRVGGARCPHRASAL
jgi:hypothetical protein